MSLTAIRDRRNNPNADAEAQIPINKTPIANPVDAIAFGYIIRDAIIYCTIANIPAPRMVLMILTDDDNIVPVGSILLEFRSSAS